MRFSQELLAMMSSVSDAQPEEMAVEIDQSLPASSIKRPFSKYSLVQNGSYEMSDLQRAVDATIEWTQNREVHVLRRFKSLTFPCINHQSFLLSHSYHISSFYAGTNRPPASVSCHLTFNFSAINSACFALCATAICSRPSFVSG